MFGLALIDLGGFVRHDVLVFHRVQRQVDTRHRANFACPQTTSVDHMLCMDCAFVGDHVPRAIRARVGFLHHDMRFNRSPTHACGLGIGMCGP